MVKNVSRPILSPIARASSLAHPLGRNSPTSAIPGAKRRKRKAAAAWRNGSSCTIARANNPEEAITNAGRPQLYRCSTREARGGSCKADATVRVVDPRSWDVNGSASSCTSVSRFRVSSSLAVSATGDSTKLVIGEASSFRHPEKNEASCHPVRVYRVSRRFETYDFQPAAQQDHP